MPVLHSPDFLPFRALVLAGLLFLALVAAPGLAPSAHAAEAPESIQLSIDTAVGTEGYFVLSWSVPQSADNPVLQQSADGSFDSPKEYPIDSGGSMTLSGFPDGQYHFRAGTPGNWSDNVTITISHHSLGRALGFFFLGLSLFIVLAVTIVKGNHQHGLEVAALAAGNKADTGEKKPHG